MSKSLGWTVAVHCSECAATVRADVYGEYVATSFEPRFGELPDYRMLLAVCPACGQTIGVCQESKGESDIGEWLWSRAVRLWPQPERSVHSALPAIVRVSLQEAEACHRARVFTACAIMCGRALEGVCSHFNTKSKTLANGLKELLERDLIDHRLLQWSEELRKQRNLAAHATEQETSQDDATDLLDFLHAICEYIFVLTPKFQSFMARKAGAERANVDAPTGESTSDGLGAPAAESAEAVLVPAGELSGG